jgi:glyoxylase-like metal-dependent hydrolase (beta-lactamase superfamily II)
MQEISKDIFIETKYSGVVVGVILTKHGAILIDSPFRIDDVKAWRLVLNSLGGMSDRLLINLDTHMDRTLGVKGMESPVIVHNNAISMVKSRPGALRAQELEAGAMWETYDGLSNMRWVPPEITFDEKLFINWDERNIVIEHHSGANSAGIWVKLPAEKIVFVGDSVLVRQPPFLAFADIDAWLMDLKKLLSVEYRDYTIIGGRNGVVTKDDVREMSKILKTIQNACLRVQTKGVSPDSAGILAEKLSKYYEDQKESREIFVNRLKWGLSSYFDQHHFPKKQ